MCYGAAPRKYESGHPESRLAGLMRRELDVTVPDNVLRLFIKAHWSKITKLAHEIHDGE